MKLPEYAYFHVFTHAQNTIVTPHYHNCYELTYYTDGTSKTTVDGKTYTCGPSHFMLYPPMRSHNEEHLSEVKVFCLGFFSDNLPIDKCITGLDTDKAILKLLNQIQNEKHFQQPHFAQMCSLITGELLIQLNRLESKDGGSPSGFVSILKYIDENLSSNIDLHYLAELSGYSYDHFRHLFKEVTGQSPLTYIIDKKIELSKLLLANSTMYIADIAASCGFGDISQFSVSFKKLTGQTPSSYRKTHNKQL